MAGPRPSDESLIKVAGILVAEQSLEKTLRQVLDLSCAAQEHAAPYPRAGEQADGGPGDAQRERHRASLLQRGQQA